MGDAAPPRSLRTTSRRQPRRLKVTSSIATSLARASSSPHSDWRRVFCRVPVTNAAPGPSVLALQWDDGAAMGAIAHLLVFVARFYPEAELATIDLEQLGAYRHLPALGGGAEVLNVDFEPDGRMPFGQMLLHGLNGGAFHQADHGGCRQHTFAPHVRDHQLVVDRRDDLCFEAWCKGLPRHGRSPRVVPWRWSAGVAH